MGSYLTRKRGKARQEKEKRKLEGEIRTIRGYLSKTGETLTKREESGGGYFGC